MIHPDVFVGLVAFVVGAFTLGSAIFNWDFAFQLRKTNWLDSKYSRQTARLILGGLGVILLLLSCYLALGFASPHGMLQKFWPSSSQSHRTDSKTVRFSV